MRWFIVSLALILVPACGKCGASGKQKKVEEHTTEAPKADTPGTRFRAALVAARAAEVKKDWPPAIAAYAEATALLPDQPSGFEGLARSALGGGEFDRALAAAEQGLLVAIDPKVQGALLALLGRALDGKGDKAGALRAVTRSRAVWPTPQIARLAAEIAGTAPAEQLTPIAARGPFKAPADYCAEAAKAPTRPADWACTGEVSTAITGPSKAPPGAAPFGEVRVLDEGGARKDCLLAVELASGWQVAELHRACQGAGASLEMVEISTVAPKAGGDPFLYLRFKVTSTWRDVASDGSDLAIEDTDTILVLCGVGVSKGLACTPHVPMHSERSVHGSQSDYSSAFDIKFNLTGPKQIGLTTEHKNQLDVELRDLIGKHSLAWP